MSEDNKSKYPNRSAEKFVVRLPVGMRERISTVAKNCHRSMNSEIVLRLEQSLNQAQTLHNSNSAHEGDYAPPPVNTTQDYASLSMQDNTLAQSELEQHLIMCFRQLTPEQQRALTLLLKD